MVANKRIDKVFCWGDDVRILESAPSKYHRVEIGSICGVRTISDDQAAIDFGEPKGSKVYLVEGTEGVTLEVPERHLAKFDSQDER